MASALYMQAQSFQWDKAGLENRPMPTIAFLACATTLPGSGCRREDAYEHDLMVAALEPELEARNCTMKIIDWEAELSAFEGVDLALLGTSWNYQDKSEAFLEKLQQFENAGIICCNSAQIAHWNSRKTYLRELGDCGAPTVPTLWVDKPGADDVAAAFAHFRCDKLVVKRQVGAGALGQELLDRASPPPPDWRFQRTAMLQPFLPAIESEGELSFIFIDGELSHALRKIPAKDDYRIQSLYGGREREYTPDSSELTSARQILDALPFDAPLYARIDMVRGPSNRLLVMEAELVEPYLYPEQGPQLGALLAEAIIKRV